MNLKFWTWPRQIRELTNQCENNAAKARYLDRENERLEGIIANAKIEDEPPRLVLRGLSEAELAAGFAGAPDNRLFTATLEQADRDLMELVNDLVNRSETMTNEQLREHAGQMVGLTQFRAKLEQREAEARERLAPPPKEN